MIAAQENRSARRWAYAAMLAACLWPQHAYAAESYLWADAQAGVHEASSLAAVPEPYRSAYAALKLGAARNGPAPGPTPADAATGVDSSPDAQRALWQGRLAAARAELLTATQAWAQLDAQAAQLGANPILRLTPQVRAQLAQGEEPRAKARQRLLEALKVVETTLPNAARAARVPPVWLQ